MIQKCLNDNNYQESACEEVLELMRECCRKYKDKSVCCEGIDIESVKTAEAVKSDSAKPL